MASIVQQKVQIDDDYIRAKILTGINDGLTQQEIAEQFGKNKSWLNYWLNKLHLDWKEIKKKNVQKKSSKISKSSKSSTKKRKKTKRKDVLDELEGEKESSISSNDKDPDPPQDHQNYPPEDTTPDQWNEDFLKREMMLTYRYAKKEKDPKLMKDILALGLSFLKEKKALVQDDASITALDAGQIQLLAEMD